MTDVTFGEWLKRRRGALGLTQEQLAQQVSCSTIALRKIEAEERHPSEQIVERLAEVFNIVPEERKSFLRFARGDWQFAPTAMVEDAPWRGSAAAPRSNLPIPLTSFVGREKEVEEIIRLVGQRRLVTLTGPGGVGKTRLAIQAANHSLKSFQDGVFWVGLVGLADGNLIPQEIAQSLNVREVPHEPLIETLKTQLKSKDLLIILDNCEHLIRACAHYAEQLLAACLKLKILATSIEAFGLFNETTWQVPSLPLPEGQPSLSPQELQEFASIELFVERACAVKPDFTLTQQNARSVVQICYRLDGIPLAIELAAARAKVLSVEEIAARLNDRFSLLTTGSRTAIPRHQTLRAVIDWSYELLTEPERILFQCLSVFAGGFTLDAAEAVCGFGELKRSGIIDLLGRLVDKSLVIVESAPALSETRYHLLETIREYAREKLEGTHEADTLHDRHLEFFATLVEKTEAQIFGVDQVTSLDRLEAEAANVRAAMEWSLKGDRALSGLRLVAALCYYWFSFTRPFWFTLGRPLSDAYLFLEQTLQRPAALERTTIRAKALNAFGWLSWGEPQLIDARPYLHEALEISTELGDKWNLATSLCLLGVLAATEGDYVQARSLLEQSRAIGQQLGADYKMVNIQILQFLGDVALNQGNSEQAQDYYQKSIVMLGQIKEKSFTAYGSRRLGQLAVDRGDLQQATEFYKQSLTLNTELGDLRAMIACVAAIAGLRLQQGQWRAAALLFGAVHALLNTVGLHLLPVDELRYQRNLATVRNHLDEANFAEAWADGRVITLEQAIEYALSVKTE